LPLDAFYSAIGNASSDKLSQANRGKMDRMKDRRKGRGQHILKRCLTLCRLDGGSKIGSSAGTWGGKADRVLVTAW